MRRKIDALVCTAALFGHADLVLCPWGCGAFGNPVRDVADLFVDALEGRRLHGRFRRIVFTVLDHKGEGDREKFEDVLKGQGVVVS